MLRFAIVALMVVCFFSCSGGGSGGNNGPPGEDDPDGLPEQQRALDFLNEAIARVVDSTIVDCEATFCSGEAVGYEATTFEEGVVGQGCRIRCLPVEIDESGEVRYFQVNIQWVRLETACFVHEDYIVSRFFTHEEPGLCTPQHL